MFRTFVFEGRSGRQLPITGLASPPTHLKGQPDSFGQEEYYARKGEFSTGYILAIVLVVVVVVLLALLILGLS